MSPAIDLTALPVVVEGPGVEIRGVEAGELTVALVRLQAGHDARPLFRGLPDDLCQCPHWGYVIRGTLRIWMSTLMKPRSVTATPALSAAIFLPLGVRPTACSTRS